MLVKINGDPMKFDWEQVREFATQPINVEFTYGTEHLISADLNPINAPQHVWDGIVHFPDAVATAFHFVSKLF